MDCMNKKNDSRWAAEKMTSEDDLAFVLNDAVYYEIICALGVSADTKNDAAWEHMNFARMVHARVLREFFEHSKEWRSKRDNLHSDDVISEDYGFRAALIELPQEDENRLNKDMLHLTYSRLRHLEQPDKKPWPDSILMELHKRCICFIEHLLSSQRPPNIKPEEEKWRDLSTILKSGRELRISWRAQSGWETTPGEMLNGGLSRLTRPAPRADGDYLANTAGGGPNTTAGHIAL